MRISDWSSDVCSSDLLYDWAGQDRTVNIAKGGSSFAAVPYVARELDKRFADMGAQSGFLGLPRDEFFDRLGDHINEINAIHPFLEGNGRTMRQIGRAHDGTTVTNAHLVCRLLLEKKKNSTVITSINNEQYIYGFSND